MDPSCETSTNLLVPTFNTGKRNREDLEESNVKRIKTEECIQVPPTKRCTVCKNDLVLTQFSSDKSHKDGLRSSCLCCSRKQSAARRKLLASSEKPVAITKVCSKCKILLDFTKFHRYKAGKDGLQHRCKSCMQKARKKRPSGINGKNMSGTKCCTKCKQVVDVKDFSRDKSTKDGLNSRCKSCAKVARRKSPFAISLTKCCGKCKKTLELNLFLIDKRARDGHSRTCKSCYCKTRRSRYDPTKGHDKYRKKKAYYNNLRLQAGCCANCQSTENIQNLQFAHYSRKDKSRRRSGKLLHFAGSTIKQMNEELKLGRFLCMRCHCIETAAENRDKLSNHPITSRGRQFVQERRVFVNKKKLEIGGCQQPGCLKTVSAPFSYWEFDHLPQYVKIDTISNMVGATKPIEMICDEIKKCQLLCADCHRNITAQRRVEKKALATKVLAPT